MARCTKPTPAVNRRETTSGITKSRRAAYHAGRVSPFGGVVAILINPAQVVAFAGDPSLPLPLAMLEGVWTALATGCVSNTGDAATDALLSRGGMAHMPPTV